MATQRLTRQKWIDAGLDALILKGPPALAAEPLARDLGATKGSFYWHFKDVPALHEAVVKDWQSRALSQIAEALAKEGNSEKRLRRFGAQFVADKQDPAFRAWAHTSPMVADALSDVDQERLTYLVNLLNHLGVRNPAFAQSCLGALIGLPQLQGQTKPTQAFDTMVDLVLALK
ncbi:TetR/AcrR family transcriptional regulator [uncultured Roseobacter sp.]|uniref:TetR/AcrR family transcriptional regulator n=1 Tax=uncultured Roseobacter sp. TaxID=114847 RepID=UPI00262A2883|nr:TetR/AcrR family transcriptional regulator [uncultured Roseobacter sp.]